jgi:hypothetical protein
MFSGIFGETSLFPTILTDAPSFSLSGTMTIFGIDVSDPTTILAVTLNGIAIPQAIPVPAPLVLFGSGAVLLGWIARRRRSL